MRQDQYPAFRETLSNALSFYRQDVTPFMLDVWWSACHGYELEQVAKALTKHCMDPDHGHFAPKPADIVRQLGGTATDRAMLAWGKTLEAMQSVGAYSDVVFDDPAIHAVVEDLGGWPKVCRGEIKDLGYLQHRFCEAHRAYVGRGEFEYPRSLRGDRAPDDAFAKRGLPPPNPAVVGDKSKAMQVYTRGATGGKTRIEFSVADLAIDALMLGA
jgi:hypothetical protein